METASSFQDIRSRATCFSLLVQPPRRACLHQNQSLTNIMWTPLPPPQHIKPLCSLGTPVPTSSIFVLFLQKSFSRQAWRLCRSSKSIIHKFMCPGVLFQPRQQYQNLIESSTIYQKSRESRDMCECPGPRSTIKPSTNTPSSFFSIHNFPPLSPKRYQETLHGDDGFFQNDPTHDICVRSCPLFLFCRNTKEPAELDMRVAISKVRIRRTHEIENDNQGSEWLSVWVLCYDIEKMKTWMWMNEQRNQEGT